MIPGTRTEEDARVVVAQVAERVTDHVWTWPEWFNRPAVQSVEVKERDPFSKMVFRVIPTGFGLDDRHFDAFSSESNSSAIRSHC